MALGSETVNAFLQRSVGQTLEDVSHRDLPAAGGSSAGLAAALAAALASMSARGARTTWEGSGGAIAQAEVLRKRLCALTAKDTEAYVRARRLLSLAERAGPASENRSTATPADADERDGDLADALMDAAGVPLAMAETAADVAALAAWTANAAGAAERADAVVAAILAEAAAASAAQLVLANLAVQPEHEFARRAGKAARAALESRASAEAPGA